ncbi:Hpt domain-containing protein [Hymenobacter sp. BT664]|uniref:Hpt domain-containing protein n=1 Tax=Hymenobacter montanus TaxID=2771359 RepID=A0A927B947_9BACT|nr:Hpt domain-containing protein [Hymenobacter montanus]MBD2766400.1 Hpt domain-containing protein [Hymenobacter montanus]
MLQPSSTQLAPGVLPSGRLYDFSRLGKLADDPEFVRRFQLLFVTHVPEQLTQLCSAIAAADWTAAAGLAHGLKSTLGTMGQEQCTRVLHQLEDAAQLGTVAQPLADQLATVVQIVERVIQVFTDELHRAA